MIAKAYRMAGAIRAAGVPVVMSGPPVTEIADEALGRSGGVRYADAVARGEADQTWPKIVEDAAQSNGEGYLCPGGCVWAGTQTHSPAVQLTAERHRHEAWLTG